MILPDTPMPAELWALTDPANGAVIDVDADQLALPTVTYVRDVTDRIVARTATGEGTVRYAHSGAGDAPQVTLNTSNQVTRVTVALPGGGIYHHDPVSPTTSKWSYPNLQGTIAAQANMSGVKLGATMIFDPDGIPVAGGTADTRPASMDDAWLGGHARPAERLAGLQPAIEMGSRLYSPVIGRFLEADPIEGGLLNDYGYVADTVNQMDVSGEGGNGSVYSICLRENPGWRTSARIRNMCVERDRRSRRAVSNSGGECVPTASLLGGTVIGLLPVVGVPASLLMGIGCK